MENHNKHKEPPSRLRRQKKCQASRQADSSTRRMRRRRLCFCLLCLRLNRADISESAPWKHATSFSVTPHQFSPCLPLNCPGITKTKTPHLDLTLPCDVTHHRKEPLATVPLRSPGIGVSTTIKSSCISLYFSRIMLSSKPLSVHHVVASLTIAQYLFVPAAPTFARWMAHPHGCTTNNNKLISLSCSLYYYIYISSMFRPDRTGKPAVVAYCHKLRCGSLSA